MIGRRPATSVVAGVGPFAGYPERQLRPLARHADRLRLSGGTQLAHQGRTAREVIVVIDGMVLACRDGREVGRFGPGDALGASEVLAGMTHPHTLVALGAVDVLVVNGPAYRWAAQTLPGLPGLAAA